MFFFFPDGSCVKRFGLILGNHFNKIGQLVWVIESSFHQTYWKLGLTNKSILMLTCTYSCNYSCVPLNKLLLYLEHTPPPRCYNWKKLQPLQRCHVMRPNEMPGVRAYETLRSEKEHFSRSVVREMATKWIQHFTLKKYHICILLQ